MNRLRIAFWRIIIGTLTRTRIFMISSQRDHKIIVIEKVEVDDTCSVWKAECLCEDGRNGNFWR